MKENELKEKSGLRDLIIATLATVLGGIILAWIPATRNFFAGVFNAIGKLLAITWKFLISKGEFPWTVIVILSLLSIPTLVKFVRKFIPKPESKSDTHEPSMQDYVEDKFFGAIWRWDSGKPAAFCPRCQTRLVYKLGYAGHGIGVTTSLYCETCDITVVTLDGDRDQILGMVTRQIEKKLNTGEWKQVVEKK